MWKALTYGRPPSSIHIKKFRPPPKEPRVRKVDKVENVGTENVIVGEKIDAPVQQAKHEKIIIGGKQT